MGDVEKDLYSFTQADQDSRFVFGIDTTTQEGREQFKKEWETMCQLCPELLSKEDMVYPHEQRWVSNEPHFRRIWQHYREHMFKLRVAYLVENGQISSEDAAAMKRFLGLNGTPTLTTYLYARLGKLPHVEQDADFQATHRVMTKLGLDHVEIDRKSAQPYEEQFWEQYDVIQELTEEEMRKELPGFVTDPSNKAKVEALLAGRRAALGHEETQKLAASL